MYVTVWYAIFHAAYVPKTLHHTTLQVKHFRVFFTVKFKKSSPIFSSSQLAAHVTNS